jgi:hypothetical protein
LTDGPVTVDRVPEGSAWRFGLRAANDAVTVQWTLSFTEPESLVRCVRGLCDAATDWPGLFGLDCPEWASLLDRQRVARIHFGNEFCQRLLPSVRTLQTVLGATAASGLGFGLALPMLTDDSLEEADALLAMLPEGTEVTVNDWGSMRRLTRRFPGLRPTAGRLLCRMLKEPRAPSAAFLELGGHGFMTPGLESLLERFGVSRLEIDVPPFARGTDLHAQRGRISVHAPFGFATTGRICRIGNLHRPMARKFETGHICARECLTYWCELTARGDPHGGRMRLFQRGNTIFYRHTVTMTQALAEAVAAGSVDRVVISGDWNAAGRTDFGT